jgi:type IV pilus assembly protein PilE
MAMRNRTQSGGFTLIELMIVVAIVAILAAIAYPSYQDSVRKSRRADAQAVLLEAAQWLERHYTANHTYVVDFATAFPTALKKSPKDGGPAGGYYAITLATAANTFTLTAAPQPTGGQDKDKCGGLTLTHTGAKGVQGAGATVAQCW